MQSIVGGLEIHWKQITVDYVDLDTGEVRWGQIAPADQEHFRSWLARRAEELPALALGFGWVWASSTAHAD